MNMLSTIDRVTAGHIYYGETDITELSDEALAEFRKDNLGFIFQDYNLLDTLTIEENIVLAMTLHSKSKREIQEKCDHILKLLDIEEIRDKFPYQVSGGQKQRCACARAMIHRPKLILADEPTGALDSRAAQMLLETFRKMNRDMHSTILMVTHDAFSASYCSRILFLKDGKIFHELVRGVEERREFLNFSKDLQKMYEMAAIMAAMIGIATFFIVLIVAWLINYMVRFMLEKRSREFGIYLLIGMNKKEVSGLYMKENLLLGVCSFVIGLGLGMLLQQVLLVVLYSVIQVELRPHLEFNGYCFLMTVCCFAGCYLLALFR